MRIPDDEMVTRFLYQVLAADRRVKVTECGVFEDLTGELRIELRIGDADHVLLGWLRQEMKNRERGRSSPGK